MSPGAACGALGLQPNNLGGIIVVVEEEVVKDFVAIIDNRDNDGADLCDGILQH